MSGDVSQLDQGNTSIPRGEKRPLAAYQSLPAGEGPFPGVIVIHELFGLNDNIRDIADRLAQVGYAALAVDLFSTGSRVSCLLRILYGMMIKPLHNGTVDELKRAIAYWRDQPRVDGRHLGVIGFCMGGTYALQLASLGGEVTVASVFYGQNPRPIAALAGACPIVGSYPDKDFTTKGAGQLAAALQQYRVPHDIKIYDDTRHSFFNDRGRNYAPAAAADAWQRTLAYFEAHLQPTKNSLDD